MEKKYGLVRVDLELLKRLKKHSEKSGVSMRFYVDKLIRAFLGKKQWRKGAK